MDKILLIDGNSILNRAFYGVPILTNSKGEYTNAVYGFLNIMLKIIEDEKPTHLLVCFDMKAKTFRHLMYEDYKGTRKGMPEELVPQLQTIKDVLSSMNIPLYMVEGFEADDLLGTFAKYFESINISPVIVSGDKDLLQIATDNIKIKIPKTSKGNTIVKDYFANDVLEEFEVTPTEFIDLKGLMGDSSDNVPGVPSVGIKTATKIIKEFHSIENALENIDSVMPKKARENLAEFKDQALLSKQLVTIKTDCPITVETDSCKIENMFNENAYKLFIDLELKTYYKRFENTDDNGGNSTVEKSKINYEVIDNPFDLENALDKILKADKMAFNVMLELENLICISISIEEGYVYIFNVFEGLIESLKEVFESNISKISYNLKDDLTFFDKRGINLNNVTMDASICAYAINPSRENYNFDTLSIDYLGEYTKSKEDILLKGKSEKSINSINEDEKYNLICTITDILFRVEPVLKQRIIDEDKENLLYDIEMPLSTVLYKMEKAGIFIDKKALLEFKEMLETELLQLTEQIYTLAGDTFNINSPSQVGVILFDVLGLIATKKTKMGYSTSNEVLENLADKHEIVPLIIKYRTYAKLKSTYADGLFTAISLDDKIHSTFNQTVTATGRISSTNPNLQNIPTRTTVGRELRRAFVPTNDDYMFLSADYNQIELRVLAHLSEDETLINAFNNDIDIHKLTASEVFHIPFDDVTSEQRSNAKAVNFGIVYGMGAFSLSKDLNITRKEADRYILGYFNRYPKVKTYLDSLIKSAEDTGYAKTLFNRTRNIKDINSKNFNLRSLSQRIAMNMPIQGTSADIIKIAMVNVYNRILKENLDANIILQIHDELLLEVNKNDIEKAKKLLVEEMENVVKLSVPLVVSVSEGQSWHDLK